MRARRARLSRVSCRFPWFCCTCDCHACMISIKIPIVLSLSDRRLAKNAHFVHDIEYETVVVKIFPKTAFEMKYRLIIFFFWAGMLALIGGCTIPERTPAQGETERRARERRTQHRIRIPPTPVDLIADYSKPNYGIRQMFRWAPHENEWRLTIVDPTSRLAGFHLRNPLLLPRQRSGMAIYFEIDPPDIARFLALGLRDNRATSPDSVAVIPIASYRLLQTHNETAGLFAVPLREMETASRIQDESGNWMAVSRPLNWGNITGVQLVILDPAALEKRQINVRNLQVAPKIAIYPLSD